MLTHQVSHKLGMSSTWDHGSQITVCISWSNLMCSSFLTLSLTLSSRDDGAYSLVTPYKEAQRMFRKRAPFSRAAKASEQRRLTMAGSLQ